MHLPSQGSVGVDVGTREGINSASIFSAYVSNADSNVGGFEGKAVGSGVGTATAVTSGVGAGLGVGAGSIESDASGV
jgi:hypothetical protein